MVVALDLSPRALQIAREFPPSDDLLGNFLDLGSLRPGGRVEYVAGDILDSAVCPGPFDLVIERRTAQNYLDSERAHLLTALAARLSPHGVLFTHCHDSGWRPPAKPRHVTSELCREQGWQRKQRGQRYTRAGRWPAVTPLISGRVGARTQRHRVSGLTCACSCRPGYSRKRYVRNRSPCAPQLKRDPLGGTREHSHDLGWSLPISIAALRLQVRPSGDLRGAH